MNTKHLNNYLCLLILNEYETFKQLFRSTNLKCIRNIYILFRPTNLWTSHNSNSHFADFEQVIIKIVIVIGFP